LISSKEAVDEESSFFQVMFGFGGGFPLGFRRHPIDRCDRQSHFTYVITLTKGIYETTLNHNIPRLNNIFVLLFLKI
jgi:hypothetical protein